MRGDDDEREGGREGESERARATRCVECGALMLVQRGRGPLSISRKETSVFVRACVRACERACERERGGKGGR